MQVERYGADAVLGAGPHEHRLLSMMATLVNVYRFVQRLRNMRGKNVGAIHNLTEQERDMLEWLYGEGWL